jgi:hypothetical protein
MKNLLVLSSLFLISCAKPAPSVKVPVYKPTTSASAPVLDKATTVYLICSGRLFKAVIVSMDGNEVVYRCPDQANK